jgi:hypothetical protein
MKLYAAKRVDAESYFFGAPDCIARQGLSPLGRPLLGDAGQLFAVLTLD